MLLFRGIRKAGSDAVLPPGVYTLQDLIDFCKDIGLQSSAAATRNATINLLVLYISVLVQILKGFYQMSSLLFLVHLMPSMRKIHLREHLQFQRKPLRGQSLHYLFMMVGLIACLVRILVEKSHLLYLRDWKVRIGRFVWNLLKL